MSPLMSSLPVSSLATLFAPVCPAFVPSAATAAAVFQTLINVALPAFLPLFVFLVGCLVLSATAPSTTATVKAVARNEPAKCASQTEEHACHQGESPVIASLPPEKDLSTVTSSESRVPENLRCELELLVQVGAEDMEDVGMNSITEVIPADKKSLDSAEPTEPAVSTEPILTITSLPAAISIKKQLSYADAVGYALIEVKRSRHPAPVGYDVYLGDLFPEQESVPIPSAPKAPIRRLSYADAVGYALIEVKRSRHPAPIGYGVYLGDLFPEPAESSPKHADQTILRIILGVFDGLDISKGPGSKVPAHILFSPHRIGGSWSRAMNQPIYPRQIYQQ